MTDPLPPFTRWPAPPPPHPAEWPKTPPADPFAGADAEEAIALAIGAASMCWEDLTSAGAFDSVRASLLVDQLIHHLRQLWLLGPERA